jgi:ABC transporter substrate binding protein (PQQ-dependent alcohol dehydrogenase system)
MTDLRAALLLGTALHAPLPAAAQQAPAAAAAEPAEVGIGYVELLGDPRYLETRTYARIQLQPHGRPFAGAELGLEDAATIGQVINTDFTLERFEGETVDDVAAQVRAWAGEGRPFVIADLSADDLLAVSDAVADLDVLLFNIANDESRLRGADCRANVLHVLPSMDMRTDALAQYLAVRRWDEILVLEGPLPADAEMVAALRHSADKFGLEIVEVKPFQLTNDPRFREQSNVALMTSGADHDVVFVADTDGEFGRYVPYATNLPRPVVGTAGLVPAAWHWAWERQGAPQVNSRFEALADWRMTETDWAAWVSMKAIVQGALRSKSADFVPIRDYILGERLNLDTSKGNPSSFRPWDHQLRQPLLLATETSVIERPPLDGFLHAVNDLDTLGIDGPETTCSF